MTSTAIAGTATEFGHISEHFWIVPPVTTLNQRFVHSSLKTRVDADWGSKP